MAWEVLLRADSAMPGAGCHRHRRTLGPQRRIWRPVVGRHLFSMNQLMYACLSAPDSAPWFLVRTSGAPAAAAVIRRTRGGIEPLRSVYDIAPLARRVDEAYDQTGAAESASEEHQ